MTASAGDFIALTCGGWCTLKSAEMIDAGAHGILRYRANNCRGGARSSRGYICNFEIADHNLFFFSFSEEKKNQKEELFSNAMEFRPLRRSIQGSALKTRKPLKRLDINFHHRTPVRNRTAVRIPQAAALLPLDFTPKLRYN